MSTQAVGGGFLPTPSAVVQPASAPTCSRVRAYFAPVNRVTATPTLFDAASAQTFNPDAPPAPWVSLGWVENFSRSSASAIQAVAAGIPAVAQSQVRQTLDAIVSMRFVSWGKLQLALASASEQMNLLAETQGSPMAAVPTASGSTPTSIVVSGGNFSAGNIVVVDTDYSGQTGYVGSGASAAYVKSSAQVGGDADYIRRVSLNVGRVTQVNGNTLTLSAPLLAGAPTAGLGVQQVVGFQDREGGSFFQEWSALFAMQGQQGDWIFYHYPRLQAMKPSAETAMSLEGPLACQLLQAQLRALPVTDNRDGATVLCYRSYLPASMMAIG